MCGVTPQGDGRSRDENSSAAKGQRAEEVASWYLRLNGFFTIPSFVVHVDAPPSQRASAIQRTDADFLAVRFPGSREVIQGKTLSDDDHLLSAPNQGKTLFVLAEVKAGPCRLNGPWTDPEKGNMQRVLRRMGFTSDDEVVEQAAASLYQMARWESDSEIVQYVCFGRQVNEQVARGYADLIQITWTQIGAFLLKRYQSHPLKTPGGKVHSQWPGFGKRFGEWAKKLPDGDEDSSAVVCRYIDSGTLWPVSRAPT